MLGTIDIPIRDLVHLVNSLPSYVTTSSCSGRISCYYSSASKGIEWIYVKHRTITCDEMELLLGEGGVEVLPEKLLMLKCEPAILHILCSDLNAAHNLHQVAYSCGYRESGIGIGKKIIVAIRTTAFSLEVPISQGGNLLITNDGLKVLVQECNSRLIRNFDRIQRLLNVLKTTHNWPTLSLPLNTQRQKIRTYQIVTELHQSDIILPMCSTLENFISSLEIQHYALLNWKTNIFPALADIFLFSGGRKSLEIQLPCIWCVVIKSPNSPCNLTFAQTGDIPSNRWGHSLCKFDSRRMLLVGGRNRQTVFDDAYLLEICDSGSESVILFHWTQIASYPCPIFYHAASFLGDTRGCLISGGLCKFQLQNPDIQLTEMFSYRLTSTSRFAATHLKNKFSEELDEATEVIFHTLSWIRVDFPLTSTYRFGHTMTLIGAQTLIIIGGDSFYPFRCDGKSGEIELWDLHFSDSPSLQISLRSSCKSSKYELAFGERSYHQTVLLDDHILVFGGSLHCEALLGSLLNAPPIELTYFDHRFSHERFLSSCKTFPDPAMLIPTHLTKQLKNFLETFSCYNKARRIVSPAIADLSPIFQIELCGECVSFNDVNHLTNLSRLEKWKAIPFTHQFWDLLTENISFRHDLAASLAGEFPDNIALYVVNINNSPQSKISSTSGSKKAVLYLQGLIPEILKQVSISKPDDLPKIENELHCDIPAKFEFVGDIIMIPECSLLMAEWELHLCFSMIFQKLLDIFNESGKNDSTKLKYTRIARKAQIDPGPMRESRVRILHPNESNTSGWVELIENKILYGFDITKVMYIIFNSRISSILGFVLEMSQKGCEWRSLSIQR